MALASKRLATTTAKPWGAKSDPIERERVEVWYG
jgi:hypothetical protein